MTSLSRPSSYAFDVVALTEQQIARGTRLWRAAPHACIDVPVDTGVRADVAIAAGGAPAHVAVFRARQPWHGELLGQRRGASALLDVLEALEAAASLGFGANSLLAPRFRFGPGGRALLRPDLAADDDHGAQGARLARRLVVEHKRALLAAAAPGVDAARGAALRSWWRRAQGALGLGAGDDSALDTAGARVAKTLMALARDDDADVASLCARLVAFFASDEAAAFYEVDGVLADGDRARFAVRLAAEPGLWRVPAVAAAARARHLSALLDELRADHAALDAREEHLLVRIAGDDVDDALIALVADADAPQRARVTAARILGVRRTARAAPALHAALREPLAWLREAALDALASLPGERALVVDERGLAPCPHAWDAAVPTGPAPKMPLWPSPSPRWSAPPLLFVEERYCAECDSAVVRARDFWRVPRPVPRADDGDAILVGIEGAPPEERALLLGAHLTASAWDGDAELRHPGLHDTLRILNAGGGVLALLSERDGARVLDVRRPGTALDHGPLRFRVAQVGRVVVDAADGRLGETIEMAVPMVVG